MCLDPVYEQGARSKGCTTTSVWNKSTTMMAVETAMPGPVLVAPVVAPAQPAVVRPIEQFIRNYMNPSRARQADTCSGRANFGRVSAPKSNKKYHRRDMPAVVVSAKHTQLRQPECLIGL